MNDTGADPVGGMQAPMDGHLGQQAPAEQPEPQVTAGGARLDDVATLTRRRRALLEGVLSEELGDLGVTGLREIAGGLESVVYRADSARLGPVAIKLPLQRVLSTGNESSLDTQDLLGQEFRLGRLVRGRGVPCPEPFVLYTDDESVDFLIVGYVETDGSAPSLGALGELVRLIHSLDVDPLPLVAMESERTAEAVVVRRLLQRYDRLCRRVSDPGGPFDLLGALALAGPIDDTPVLLHMDARPANLLTCRGKVRGIVDWSNALFGPAALELARIAESGNLTSAFLAGYGIDDPFRYVDPVREVVYRLDTAVMLAHVFLDNDAPPTVQQRQVARVRHLVAALVDGVRPDDSFIFQSEVMKT